MKWTAPSFLAVLALLVVAPAARAAPEDAPDAGAEWIRKLDAGDLAVRRKAVYEIWQRVPGLRGAGPALARAVASPDEYLRGTAVKAIWKILPVPADARSVVPGVLDALKSPHAPVRVDAAALAMRLSRYEADRAADLLAALDDLDPTVRANVAAALGVAGWRAKEAVVPALAKRLNDPNADTRKWAAKALATLDPAAIVAPASARLASEDVAVRADAATLLALSFGHGRSALPLLAKSASDSDPEVRKAALAAIGAIGPEAALPVLAKALGDESPDVRAAAAGSLSLAADLDEPARAALARATADEDVNVRRAALGVLVNRPDTDTAVLTARLTDPDPTVRYWAVFGLGSHRDEAALAALEKLLKQDDDGMRGAAVAAIGRMGESAKGALEAVLAIARSDDASRANQALSSAALIAPDDASVLAVFARRLGSDDPAAYGPTHVLGVHAAPLVPEIARRLEAAADTNARRTLIYALRAIGPAAVAAAPALRKATKADPEVRLDAADAFVTIGGDGAEEGLAVLVAALDDPSDRARAVAMLTRLGPAAAGALPALEALLAEPPAPDPAVPFVTSPNTFATAVATIGGPQKGKKGYDFLLDALRAENPFDPAAEDAAIRLGGLGASAAEAVPALTAALDSPNPMLRAGAAEALGRIGPAAAPALPRLRELAVLESPAVRRTVHAARESIAGG